MKFLKYFFSALGLVLVFNAISVFVMENFTFGSVLCFLLGLAIFWASFCANNVKKPFLKFLKAVVIFMCIFATVCSLFLEFYGHRKTYTGSEDAVIVLGAAIKGDEISYALKTRLDKTYEIMTSNKNLIAVVSGGKGDRENISEADAMKNYLVKMGIDEKRIIKEDKATSTYENFVYSDKILKNYFGRKYKAVFITNYFHVFRSVNMCKMLFIDANYIGTDIALSDLVPNDLREICAIALNYIKLKG